MLSVISATELFFAFKSAALYLYFSAAFIAMVLYLIMTLVSSKLLHLWEEKLSGTDSYELAEDERGAGAILGVEDEILSYSDAQSRGVSIMQVIPSRDFQHPVLHIRHLSKSFGNHRVLEEIDVIVYTSDVISIIGASGSGKSILLRCINLF